jgi:hypothetical protein
VVAIDCVSNCIASRLFNLLRNSAFKAALLTPAKEAPLKVPLLVLLIRTTLLGLVRRVSLRSISNVAPTFLRRFVLPLALPNDPALYSALAAFMQAFQDLPGCLRRICFALADIFVIALMVCLIDFNHFNCC